ncbi:two-component sensor histidine kinase [Paenibacillus sp. FSL H8-0548]|uniref:sensor histidine kinase n=1 Tax=Paenibacillus sp. FSL H8-0548 TaxID=1920422 RepID=UPI00096D1010|nr:HAMP domain-containing sensor histidine kinase [Paenibacillus sp. FSL H8-0548]OMF38020.1 two-component sensor histidine kinase [Paenibacillus sp. FSL H8-0548]
MSLSSWLKNWLTAAALMLVFITLSSAGMLLYSWNNDNESSQKYVINQARLAVNPFLLYLEHNSEEIRNDHVQETLDKMTASSGMDLIYVELDGTVAFTTFKSMPSAPVNLKTSLHYDLYDAQQEDQFFKTAFPVIDDGSQNQVGNALFYLPKDMIYAKKSDHTPLAAFALTVFLALLLSVLLIMIRKKIKHHLISPIITLKHHSEAILKGNYEEKSQYARMDELGGLYAMFDQMRMEIMHLSTQRVDQEKAQKELITNISHEIKTPLTTVNAYIEAILEGVCPDTETMMEYVEVMRSNTDKMTRLVEDLLVHALQELGQISVDPTEQYSSNVLQDILKPIGHYVRTNGVTYMESHDIPNVLIPIDAVRIEQVITNLVSNALKHTSPGDTIRIGIELASAQLTFTIADTGRGIKPQDMPFLFERYFSGQGKSTGTAGSQKGTGLGLSICKTIIEAHGGSISFQSKEGQGTTFQFTLPLC